MDFNAAWRSHGDHMRATFGNTQKIKADDYEQLRNHPYINDEEVIGHKTGADYHLQDLLVAGDNIEMEDNGDHTVTIRAIGGSSGALEADLAVSNPIGKYAKDDVIDQGTAFETIFRGLLSKTYYPTLTDPSLRITYGAPELMKVGAMVAAQRATLIFNRGLINPQYTAESPYRSGESTEHSVSLSGANIQYSDSKASNQFDIPTFTRNSKGNVTLTGTASYAAGVQPKDSDGQDYQSALPAGSKSASKTIEFILPFYWGKKTASSISGFAGLTEDLSKKGNKTYTYANADNEYLYIVYDEAYGNLKSILDENNFENIDSWERSTLYTQDEVYTVYRSGFAITGNPPFTFKF